MYVIFLALHHWGEPHHMLLAVQDWKCVCLLVSYIQMDIGKGKLTKDHLTANHPVTGAKIKFKKIIIWVKEITKK